jgi:hypothetical protein
VSKRDKLIQKILSNQTITFSEADKVLIILGYISECPGSSHITYRKDANNLITLVIRKELKPYEVKKIQDILKKEGY